VRVCVSNPTRTVPCSCLRMCMCVCVCVARVCLYGPCMCVRTRASTQVPACVCGSTLTPGDPVPSSSRWTGARPRREGGRPAGARSHRAPGGQNRVPCVQHSYLQTGRMNQIAGSGEGEGREAHSHRHTQTHTLTSSETEVVQATIEQPFRIFLHRLVEALDRAGSNM